LRYLLRQLHAHCIEVRKLEQSCTSGEVEYPAGSWVVRCDQPYRNALITFLDVQEIPADEPNAPYDDVAWTWPLLQDVQGKRIDEAAVLAVPMSAPVDSIADVPGTIAGTGPVYLWRDQGQTALATARLLLGKANVQAADTSFAAAGQEYPAGSWIVRAPRERVEDVARQLGLDFTAVDAAPAVRAHAVDMPRLAVLHTWVATQDCGWVRYTLDQARVPYTLIHDGDLRKGRLRARFDVVLFPDSWGDFATLVHGIDPKYGPLAYTRTSEYPSHGFPDASSDITGGMGFAGLLELQRFVDGGGVLVALANAGTVVADGGLARGLRTLSPDAVRSPGSELRTKVLQPLHPVAYGYDERTSVFRGNGPLWEVADRDRKHVVLQFGTKKVPEEDETPATAAGGATAAKPAMAAASPAAPPASPAPAAQPGQPAGKGAPAEDLVLSGFASPKEKLDGMPAILDLPAGKGRVLLFAFNPMHRYLNHSDFRFVYNAILNWDDLPSAR